MLSSPRWWMLRASLFACVVAAVSVADAAPPTREQIVEYISECKESKSRVDLVAKFGSDFSGMDLSRLDLRGYYANGNESWIRSASFRNCNLEGVEFGSAVLDGSDLSGANLTNAYFVTASLKGCDLRRAVLRGARFNQCDLSGVLLQNADLSGTDITGTTFAAANLSHAILAGATNKYLRADFQGANLTGADFSGLNLPAAEFQEAQLGSADFTGATLTEADFSGADLTNAIFERARIDGAIFHAALGLTPAQRNDLEGKSQRWKFDLASGTSSLLAVLHFPAYVATVLLLIGLSWPAVRFTPGTPFVRIAVCLNGLTLIPPALLFHTFRLGGHPTVQFNAGSPTAMNAWSAWVGMWPVLMLGLLGAVIVAIIIAFAFVAMRMRGNLLSQTVLPLVYLVLTVVHCLFATELLGRHFPSA